jgi:hypothetical protein
MQFVVLPATGHLMKKHYCKYQKEHRALDPDFWDVAMTA